MDTTVPHQLIRRAVLPFLRGEESVVDLTFAFRAAASEITATRPLDGPEIVLFDLLERWEEAGWRRRPALVDELRAQAARIAGEAKRAGLTRRPRVVRLAR